MILMIYNMRNDSLMSFDFSPHKDNLQPYVSQRDGERDIKVSDFSFNKIIFSKTNATVSTPANEQE